MKKVAYVDSSILLRILFNEANSLTNFNDFSRMVSSILLKTECMRVFSRLRLTRTISDEQLIVLQTELHQLLASISLFMPSMDIFERAGEDFPVALKTLDAIHLATFLNLQKRTKDSLIFLTHDKALLRCAAAMGHPAMGV